MYWLHIVYLWRNGGCTSMSLLPNFFSVLHVVPDDSAYFGYSEEVKYEDTLLTHLSEFLLENILDSRGGNCIQCNQAFNSTTFNHVWTTGLHHNSCTNNMLLVIMLKTNFGKCTRMHFIWWWTADILKMYSQVPILPTSQYTFNGNDKMSLSNYPD